MKGCTRRQNKIHSPKKRGSVFFPRNPYSEICAGTVIISNLI
jgi:hypothetical protein